MSYLPTLDRCTQQAALIECLEEPFGCSRTWPLRIRVACAQLIQLQSAIEDEAYAQVIECAEEGVKLYVQGDRFAHETHADLLSRALGFDRRRRDWPETFLVGQAILYGLHTLLGSEDYEKLIFGAAQARRI